MLRTLTFVPGVVLIVISIAATQVSVTSADVPIDARIQIVWPHDGQGHEESVENASFVNVEVYLYGRGTRNPVPCSFPNKVILRWATNEPAPSGGFRLEPAHNLTSQIRSAVGQQVMRNIDGKTFPAWVFNDVPVGAEKSTYFLVEVEGADARTNVWAHSADPRTFLPSPVVIASVRDNVPAPSVVDAYIQIVWPHDEQGRPRPVAEATLVNTAVDLTRHRTSSEEISSDPISVGIAFNQPVRLLQALNDGPFEVVETAPHFTGAISDTPEGGFSWKRWLFNDVDVSASQDPSNKYYFGVQVDGIETHTTIWAHGADARTYFPAKDVPTNSCAG